MNERKQSRKCTWNAVGKLDGNVTHDVMPVLASGHAEQDQHGTRETSEAHVFVGLSPETSEGKKLDAHDAEDHHQKQDHDGDIVGMDCTRPKKKERERERKKKRMREVVERKKNKKNKGRMGTKSS